MLRKFLQIIWRTVVSHSSWDEILNCVTFICISKFYYSKSLRRTIVTIESPMGSQKVPSKDLFKKWRQRHTIERSSYRKTTQQQNVIQLLRDNSYEIAVSAVNRINFPVSSVQRRIRQNFRIKKQGSRPKVSHRKWQTTNYASNFYHKLNDIFSAEKLFQSTYNTRIGVCKLKWISFHCPGLCCNINEVLNSKKKTSKKMG